MKLTHAALALTLALGAGAAWPTPAEAQKADKAQRKFNISSGARASIAALQTAVNANDVANIPARLAAAQAAAKTADDRYVIAQLQLQAAATAKNEAQMASALDAIIASGGAKPDEMGPLLLNLGKIRFNAKQYDAAAAAFERLLQVNPSNSDGLVLLAETRHAQGRTADALSMLQRAIAAKRAAGQPVPEAWYKRAVAIAYNAKSPAAVELTRGWVAAYPSPTSWRDSIRIFQTVTGGADKNLDLLRLQRAAGALRGESDYYTYASTAVARGLPGEAKAVLDEGFAAGAITRSSDTFKNLYASASAKAAADRPSLAGLEKAALAAATARPAMQTADAYLAYGDYAKAAALYRAALGKSGVDANLANLRLGIALARSGDKAGAATAFRAVTGAHAEIARYWLLYIGQPG